MYDVYGNSGTKTDLYGLLR